MNKLLMGGIVVLAVTVAALSAVLVIDSGGSAQANTPIDCSVERDVPEAGQYTVTCVGTISVDTPVGPQELSFSLTVVATDNPPAGPSFGDAILSCTLNTGRGDQPISVGPCP